MGAINYSIIKKTRRKRWSLKSRLIDDLGLITIVISVSVALILVFWDEIKARFKRKKKTLPAKDPIDDDPNPGYY